MSRMKMTLAIVGGVIVALFVVIGLAVGGWKGFWWIQQSSATHQLNIQQHVINRQNKIARSSYGFTTTQIQEMQSDLNYIAQEDVALQSDPHNVAIISQIQNYKQTFCNTYNEVIDPTQVPPSLAAAATQYACTAVPAA
jgi:hypothetical protein